MAETHGRGPGMPYPLTYEEEALLLSLRTRQHHRQQLRDELQQVQDVLKRVMNLIDATHRAEAFRYSKDTRMLELSEDERKFLQAYRAHTRRLDVIRQELQAIDDTDIAVAELLSSLQPVNHMDIAETLQQVHQKTSTSYLATSFQHPTSGPAPTPPGSSCTFTSGSGPRLEEIHINNNATRDISPATTTAAQDLSCEESYTPLDQHDTIPVLVMDEMKQWRELWCPFCHGNSRGGKLASPQFIIRHASEVHAKKLGRGSYTARLYRCTRRVILDPEKMQVGTQAEDHGDLTGTIIGKRELSYGNYEHGIKVGKCGRRTTIGVPQRSPRPYATTSIDDHDAMRE